MYITGESGTRNFLGQNLGRNGLCVVTYDNPATFNINLGDGNAFLCLKCCADFA